MNKRIDRKTVKQDANTICFFSASSARETIVCGNYRLFLLVLCERALPLNDWGGVICCARFLRRPTSDKQKSSSCIKFDFLIESSLVDYLTYTGVGKLPFSLWSLT